MYGSVKVIKAAVLWSIRSVRCIGIGKVPFAGHEGAVPDLLKCLGKRDGLRVQSPIGRPISRECRFGIEPRQ